MLTITVPSAELFDDGKQEFVYTPEVELELEHSLVSLSKWEQKFQKPFLTQDAKTTEETFWYIKAMTRNGDFPIETYQMLGNDNVNRVKDYISDKMTATWFRELPNQPKSREVITSEIIYHWMFSLNMPLECENWHLNRLFTLVKVISQKNTPPKKMNKQQIAQQNRELNAQRRAALGTSG